MVQFALEAFLDALRQLTSLAVPTGILLLGFLITLGVLALLDRERVRAWLDGTRRWGPRFWAWLSLAAALFAGVVGLSVVRAAVNVRLGAQENARFSAQADPEGGATVQPAPFSSYLTEKTYTRTLTLPPDFLDRLGADAVGVLAPYLTDPSSENITRLADTFRRSGRSVVFTREATLQTEQPIELGESRVNVGLGFIDPVEGGRKTYYNADFQAQYSFSNPLPTPVRARFLFPLPYGSGTLSGFSLRVNGVAVPATDLSRGVVWEDVLSGGAQARVDVRYRNQGARGWSYQLASRREPIANFDLTVKADRPAKFARYSLFPTSARRTLGGQHTLRWQLRDVITAQNVALTFSGAALRETLFQVFTFAPAALLLAALFVAVWAWKRGARVSPAAAALAALGFALGFALMGVLTGYLSAVLAGVIGAALAVLLSTLALGRTFVWPLALAALTPLAFLWVDNSGLMLGVIGVVALLSLLYGRRAELARG